MHPEEIVHYIRIVKNEKSVLYLTYKIICGRQRLYALRLEKNRAKNNCAACRKSSGRRRFLASGAFRSEFQFGTRLRQMGIVRKTRIYQWLILDGSWQEVLC